MGYRRLTSEDQRGDTIIEVVLAASIITLVLFSSWALVNRSTQLSLAARKRIEMVNQIKEQAEIIQGAYADNQQTFNNNLVTYTDVTPEATPCDGLNMNLASSVPSQSFYFGASGGGIAVSSGFKSVKGDVNSRVWVQRQRNSAGGYTDYYIRACWLSGGSRQNTENSQVIVRINS